jgi:hypothetical protein
MALAHTTFDRDGQALPALFLNTTIVADGRRLIQHPYSSLGEMPFPGSVDGAGWLPAELPVISAVSNSARFTLVSPAGTVRRRVEGRVDTLGQVVDGGYFENSATTTLAHVIERFRATTGTEAPVTVIHISNDPGVAPFARNNEESCPTLPPAEAVAIQGELHAPTTTCGTAACASANAPSRWAGPSAMPLPRKCASN